MNLTIKSLITFIIAENYFAERFINRVSKIWRSRKFNFNWL